MYQLDLASLASVRECARAILSREARVDILINNAGVFHGDEAKTEDGLEMHIGEEKENGAFFVYMMYGYA